MKTLQDVLAANLRASTLRALSEQVETSQRKAAQAEVEIGRALREALGALETDPKSPTLRASVVTLEAAHGKLLKLAPEIAEAAREMAGAAAHASREAEETAIQAEKDRQADLFKPPPDAVAEPPLRCADCAEIVESTDTADLCRRCRAELEQRLAAGDEGAAQELARYAEAARARRIEATKATASEPNGPPAEAGAGAAADGEASSAEPSSAEPRTEGEDAGTTPVGKPDPLVPCPAGCTRGRLLLASGDGSDPCFRCQGTGDVRLSSLTPEEAAVHPAVVQDDIAIDEHQEAAEVAGVVDPATGDGLDDDALVHDGTHEAGIFDPDCRRCREEKAHAEAAAQEPVRRRRRRAEATA